MKVLFLGKNLRTRRRESILNPPDGVQFVTEVPLDVMGKDSEVRGSVVNLFDNHYARHEQMDLIDLLYSPGKILFNRKPFVIEVDNVCCLTYYHLGLLKLFKKPIANRLKSKWCKKIICISEAARNSVVNYFGDKEIENKCVVIYPYIKHHHSLPLPRSDNKVRFLFNAYNWNLKGGHLVLQAFLRTQKPNWELYVISNVSERIVDEYKVHENIKFVKPNLSKDELYERYYRTCDVFLSPSFQDSFGMTNLEALSAGLPVITTKMFASPEIVLHGVNGFLIDCDSKYFDDDFLPNPAFWNRDLTKFAREEDHEGMIEELAKCMTLLGTSGVLLDEFKKAALEHANSHFSEEKRKKALKEALTQ